MLLAHHRVDEESRHHLACSLGSWRSWRLLFERAWRGTFSDLGTATEFWLARLDQGCTSAGTRMEAARVIAMATRPQIIGPGSKVM